VTIYQTIITKKILERIESESDVTWNSGVSPTSYYDDEDLYLNISDEPYSQEEWGYFKASAMCLWIGDRYKSRTLCSEDEFVAHCKRMMPK